LIEWLKDYIKMSLSVDDEWDQYLKMTTQMTSMGGTTGCAYMSTPYLENRNPSSRMGQEGDPLPSSSSLVADAPLDDGQPAPPFEIVDDLHISTKTKVLYLNQEIDIHSLFWKIPIIEYWQPTEGVVKKQIKVVSKSEEEFEEYKKKLEGVKHYSEHIIKQINNASSRRIKYKDERKITIGISKKDIMNCRSKVKNAFYNCFAIIIRFFHEGMFREIHVKVFNTGKLEIPGILNFGLLDYAKIMVLKILQPFMDSPLVFVDATTEKEENVLINSNFNCGFYVNREKLHSILSKKYGIETAYDPCTYPGVKCKFYFNNEMPFDPAVQTGKVIPEDRYMKMNELNENAKYTEVSFMVFRTGSCLIVGNCSEKILFFIFDFLKDILSKEYAHIRVVNESTDVKQKKAKIRKKTIVVTADYLANHICCS